MISDADRAGPAITARQDPRVTRIGGFLRRSKLDELPQFFNLLTGSLTLVGPRAEVPGIVVRYSDEQREVLSVKPGITGPGQLFYTTDQQDCIPEGVAPEEYYVEHLLGPKLRIDLDYIRRRTALGDLKIILSTVGHMVRSLFAPSAQVSHS
jgi:lipopolysaccharide/colanic/teichoic acid biosynthesis glycosyltransferase